jgi:type III secretory pathway component EscV
MLVVSASKTCKLLPVLVACLLAVAAVVCLVHTDGIDEVQTMSHQGHRHTSTSSAMHLTLDLHCLVAILPGVVVLVWLCLATLCLSVLLSKPVVPVFPPFIPPKALVRA